MNKVILVGNLVADPELQEIWLDDKKFTKFTVAVDTYGGTEFFDCVAFDRVAQAMAYCLTKGSEVLVEGRLAVDKWVDKDGQNRRKVEIIAENVEFLSLKREKSAEQEAKREKSAEQEDELSL